MKAIAILIFSALSSMSMAQGALTTDLVQLVNSNFNIEYEFAAAPHVTAGLGASFHTPSDSYAIGLNGYYNLNGNFGQGVKIGGGVYFPNLDSTHFFGVIGYQLRVKQIIIVPAFAFGQGVNDFKVVLGLKV